MESCTSEAQESHPFSVDGRKVVLIDTPGFGDTTLTDSDIWKIIAAFLVTRQVYGPRKNAVKLIGAAHMHSHRAGIRFAGVIYMQRISDVKVSGSARQSFKMFQELCGEETYRNVVLVTGMWDTISSEVGDSRERELASKEIFFKPVLQKGARMMRHDNTRESALKIIRSLVGMAPVTLRIQAELGGGGDIMQTSIYKEIHGVMLELVVQRKKRLDALMAEMAEAERNGDEETQEELGEEVDAAKAELQEAQNKVSRLASEYEVELRRLEGMLRRRRISQGH